MYAVKRTTKQFIWHTRKYIHINIKGGSKEFRNKTHIKHIENKEQNGRHKSYPFSQFSSVSLSCPTPWTAACQASLPITNSWSLFRLRSIESLVSFNHLMLCQTFLLPPSVYPSTRVFSNESVPQIRRPRYWNFSFSISPSNEFSGLISFRMEWLDFLAVQGTLKNLLQHHSSKASTLECSAFVIVQLSHPYMTTGKTIPLTRWTFAGKVMSLLVNMLSGLVIAFLPRSKCLLTYGCSHKLITISSDFGATLKRVCHCFQCFPIYLS